MDRHTFMELIEGEIATANLPDDDTGTVGEWISGKDVDPPGSIIMYFDTNYDYAIAIYDLHINNPPISENDIMFRELTNYEEVYEIPDTIGWVALEALPYTSDIVKYVLVGGAIAAIAVVAFTYGRTPGYYSEARRRVGTGMQYVGGRIAR